MRFLVCSLQLFLSFLLASAANAKLLAKDVNWTDKLVANRTSGCLADNILTDAARKACKTHLIRYALANKCDSKSHGEIFIECSSEDLRDAIIVPSHVYDDFYHTLNLLILLKYDIDATNLNKTENGLNASMALAYHRLKLKTDSVGPLLINELLFFNPTFFFESLENHGSNVVKSREHVFEEIVHDLRQFVLQNRTFALLKLAENLLEQKEANADELRKFNVENVVKKAMSGRAAKFPELKKRIEKFYVNLCTNYTFGIAYKYLEFLAKPNSHEEILTYYKRLFGSGHATFALGISGFFSNHKNPEKFLPLIAEKSTDERAWTDQLMVSAKVGCLSGDRLQHEAKGLCGNPSEAIAENATHFFPHSTLENYKFRMGESCKEAGKFRGIVFQCDIPWFQPSLPSKTLFELYFHDVQMAILVQYAKLAKQMLEAKEKNNAPRFTELKKRLGIKAEAMLEKWLEKTQNFDVYDRHFRYQHYTYNPKIYDSPDHLLTSREYTIRKIIGKLRVSTLVERTKILFKWATKLLKNEEIYEDEMKPFNGEKLLPRLEKISSIDGEVLAGTKERLENSYMSFCKSHTIGVNKYRLDFLEQPNAHKKLAELFRKIFAAGEIHAKY